MRFASAQLLTAIEDDLWLKLAGQANESASTVAAQVAAEQCRRLVVGGVTEFHFYTMNRSELSLATCRALGIKPNETVAPSAPTDRTVA